MFLLLVVNQLTPYYTDYTKPYDGYIRDKMWPKLTRHFNLCSPPPHTPLFTQSNHILFYLIPKVIHIIIGERSSLYGGISVITVV